MAISTLVTPAMVAVALGQTAPVPGSLADEQWQMWIDDATLLIQTRMDVLEITIDPDQAKLDYVIREAVVAHVQRPDNATQVTISVDDGSTSRMYRSSAGRVAVLDEWWRLLGLTSTSGSYAVDTVGTCTTHLPWCSLSMGALYCSCGADIAGYPIYEDV